MVNNQFNNGRINILPDGDIELQRFTSSVNYSYKDELYYVKQNEILDAIAFNKYADPRQWLYIADNNKIFDPFNVEPGTALRLPPNV